MKAMIFAAGEGRRMRPLTLATPKPLLRIGELSMLEHLVRRLISAGVTELVMNVSYLADQIITALGNMELEGISVHVSVEEYCLETGGGLVRALPYLGSEPFLLLNADVWSELNFVDLIAHGLPDGRLAHLVLVESPEHNHRGDFVIEHCGRVRRRQASDEPHDCLTFAGISVIHPDLIHRYASSEEIFPLRDLFYAAIDDDAISGEFYPGFWSDVGTPDRLDFVRHQYEGTV